MSTFDEIRGGPGGVPRREFLKQGAAGLAVISLPITLRAHESLNKVPAANPTHPFARFGVDEALIRKAMGQALALGGDYCDLYFEYTISNRVSLEDKVVNSASSRVDLGVGIRVLKGDQVGYSFSEDLGEKAVLQAARTAAAIANGPAQKAPVRFEHPQLPSRYAITTPWEAVRVDRKIPLLETLDRLAFAADPRVLKVSATYSDQSTHVLIATSKGVLVHDYRPMTTLGAYVVLQKGTQREDGWYAYAYRDDIGLYTPERLKTIAEKAVDQAARGFEAVKPQGGEMEVVLAPGGAGILLHEAIGHGLEADFNRKKTSIFSDKMGKAIAQDFVTIVDDATMPNCRGSLNVDDEGNLGQKTVLVENGRLVSYLHDHISAQHYKVGPTGNGRRQNFRCEPLPRMRNTYMLPGNRSRDEIIRSVKKGIYAEDFTNGQVQIGAGDFTFYVKSGYLIEDGKITRPIKDVNIIGNGPEVLSRVTMVGNDLEISHSTWTCGKNGQGVPAVQGLPTVKVSAITVGGVNA